MPWTAFKKNKFWHPPLWWGCDSFLIMRQHGCIHFRSDFDLFLSSKVWTWFLEWMAAHLSLEPESILRSTYLFLGRVGLKSIKTNQITITLEYRKKKHCVHVCKSTSRSGIFLCIISGGEETGTIISNNFPQYLLHSLYKVNIFLYTSELLLCFLVALEKLST